MTTQRTIDFNKIQWADYWYENQEGLRLRTKPKTATVRGVSIKLLGVARPHPDYPHETMEERARRLGLVDSWMPVCQFNVSSNRTLNYRGQPATKAWKAYNKHIYG